MPQFDALKSPLLAYAVHNARFVPPFRWVTFSPPSSTLTNFPVLVKARNYTNIANGYDVHFQDANGNELAFELDWYDNSTKSGAWWVQIPTLSSSAPTSIKMCYGDATITTDQSSPLTVWSEYAVVYHFNKLPSGTMINVAKGTSNSCGFTSPAFVSQDKGTGRALTWTSTASSTSSSNALTTRSVSLSSANHSTTALLWDRQYPSGTINTPLFEPATQGVSVLGAAEQYNSDSIQRQDSILLFKSGSYPHNVEVSATIKDTMRYYGLSFSSGSHRTIYADLESNSGNSDAYSGREFNDSSTFYSFLNFWGGTMKPLVDELRLRGTAISSAWANYEYKNYITHDTYTTYGPEEK